MRVRKWLILCGLLLAGGWGAYSLFCRVVHVSWGYCVEARFEQMPPNDTELVKWLRRQPGVVPHTVAVGRFEQGECLLYVSFIQSRSLAGKPAFPDLDHCVGQFGYGGADDPFRDSADRTRTLKIEPMD
jgi:hypothetical protein